MITNRFGDLRWIANNRLLRRDTCELTIGDYRSTYARKSAIFPNTGNLLWQLTHIAPDPGVGIKEHEVWLETFLVAQVYGPLTRRDEEAAAYARMFCMAPPMYKLLREVFNAHTCIACGMSGQHKPDCSLLTIVNSIEPLLRNC